MNEAREEVAHYARRLANPSNHVEAALTRVEQPEPEAINPDEEAL